MTHHYKIRIGSGQKKCDRDIPNLKHVHVQHLHLHLPLHFPINIWGVPVRSFHIGCQDG